MNKASVVISVLAIALSLASIALSWITWPRDLFARRLLPGPSAVLSSATRRPHGPVPVFTTPILASGILSTARLPGTGNGGGLASPCTQRNVIQGSASEIADWQGQLAADWAIEKLEHALNGEIRMTLVRPCAPVRSAWKSLP